MENSVNVKVLNNVRLSSNLTFHEARELSEIKKKIKDQNHENSRIENPNFHNPKSCSSSFKPLITLIQYYKKKYTS